MEVHGLSYIASRLLADRYDSINGRRLNLLPMSHKHNSFECVLLLGMHMEQEPSIGIGDSRSSWPLDFINGLLLLIG